MGDILSILSTSFNNNISSTLGNNTGIVRGAGALTILNSANGNTSNPSANIGQVLQQNDIDNQINRILSQGVARLDAIRQGQLEPSEGVEELAAALQLAGQPFRLYYDEQQGGIAVEVQATDELSNVSAAGQRAIRNTTAQLEEYLSEQALVDTRTNLRARIGQSILRTVQLRNFAPPTSLLDFQLQQVLTTDEPFRLNLNSAGDIVVLRQEQNQGLTGNIIYDNLLRRSIADYERAREIINVPSSRDPTSPTLLPSSATTPEPIAANNSYTNPNSTVGSVSLLQPRTQPAQNVITQQSAVVNITINDDGSGTNNGSISLTDSNNTINFSLFSADDLSTPISFNVNEDYLGQNTELSAYSYRGAANIESILEHVRDNDPDFLNIPDVTGSFVAPSGLVNGDILTQSGQVYLEEGVTYGVSIFNVEFNHFTVDGTEVLRTDNANDQFIEDTYTATRTGYHNFNYTTTFGISFDSDRIDFSDEAFTEFASVVNRDTDNIFTAESLAAGNYIAIIDNATDVSGLQISASDNGGASFNTIINNTDGNSATDSATFFNISNITDAVVNNSDGTSINPIAGSVLQQADTLAASPITLDDPNATATINSLRVLATNSTQAAQAITNIGSNITAIQDSVTYLGDNINPEVINTTTNGLLGLNIADDGSGSSNGQITVIDSNQNLSLSLYNVNDTSTPIAVTQNPIIGLTNVTTEIYRGSGASNNNDAATFVANNVADVTSTIATGTAINFDNSTDDSIYRVTGRVFLDANRNYSFRETSNDFSRLTIAGARLLDDEAIAVNQSLPYNVTQSGYYDIDFTTLNLNSDGNLQLEISDDGGATYSTLTTIERGFEYVATGLGAGNYVLDIQDANNFSGLNVQVTDNAGANITNPVNNTDADASNDTTNFLQFSNFNAATININDGSTVTPVSGAALVAENTLNPAPISTNAPATTVTFDTTRIIATNSSNAAVTVNNLSTQITPFQVNTSYTDPSSASSTFASYNNVSIGATIADNGSGASNGTLSIANDTELAVQLFNVTDTNNPITLTRDLNIRNGISETYNSASAFFGNDDIASYIRDNAADNTVNIANGSTIDYVLNVNAIERVTGDIYLEAGQTYNFRETSDDTARLSINGTQLLNDDYITGTSPDTTNTTAEFTPTASGFHSIEFFAHSLFAVGSAALEISTDGGTSYTTLTASNNATSLTATGLSAGNYVIAVDDATNISTLTVSASDNAGANSTDVINNADADTSNDTTNFINITGIDDAVINLTDGSTLTPTAGSAIVNAANLSSIPLTITSGASSITVQTTRILAANATEAANLVNNLGASTPPTIQTEIYNITPEPITTIIPQNSGSFLVTVNDDGTTNNNGAITLRDTNEAINFTLYNTNDLTTAITPVQTQAFGLTNGQLNTYSSVPSSVSNNDEANTYINATTATTSSTINAGDAINFNIADSASIYNISGNIFLQEGQTYRFRETSDDFTRLSIDDTVIVNDDNTTSATPHTNDVEVDYVATRTGFHSLDLSVYNTAGGGSTRLDVSLDGGTTYTNISGVNRDVTQQATGLSSGSYLVTADNASNLTGLSAITTDNSGANATTLIDNTDADTSNDVQNFININNLDNGVVTTNAGLDITPTAGSVLIEESAINVSNAVRVNASTASENINTSRIIAADSTAATAVITALGSNISQIESLVAVTNDGGVTDSTAVTRNPLPRIRLQQSDADIVTRSDGTTLTITGLSSGDSIIREDTNTVIASISSDSVSTLTINDSDLGSSGIVLRTSRTFDNTDITLTRSGESSTTQTINANPQATIGAGDIALGTLDLAVLQLGDGDGYVRISGLDSNAQFTNGLNNFIINNNSNGNVVLSRQELLEQDLLFNDERTLGFTFAGAAPERLLSETVSGNNGTLALDIASSSDVALNDVIAFTYRGRSVSTTVDTLDAATIRDSLITAFNQRFYNSASVSITAGTNDNELVITDNDGFETGVTTTIFRDEAGVNYDYSFGTQTENENLNNLLGLGITNPVRTALTYVTQGEPFFFDYDTLLNQVVVKNLDFTNSIPDFLTEDKDEPPQPIEAVYQEALALASEGKPYSLQVLGNRVQVRETTSINLINDRRLERALSGQANNALVSLLA